MSYRVELPVFSGPMDLLLHLVKQSEVDIHEVAIAPILADFLQHVKVLEHLDLHDIGDFVVMSSTLMEIKSRELLPNESVEIEEELDPRDDLIRRLLEYKRYRDLARELDARSGRRQRQSNLVMPQPPELKSAEDEDLLDLGELGIWDLTAAFAKLLEEVGQHQSMEIEVEMRDVGYYTRTLLDTFKKERQVKFSDAFDPKEGRYGMIGTLIALLEMMKQGYLRALQENCFDEISLAYIGEDDVTADLILAGISAEEMREDQEKAAKAAAKAAQGEAVDDDDEAVDGELGEDVAELEDSDVHDDDLAVEGIADAVDEDAAGESTVPVEVEADESVDGEFDEEVAALEDAELEDDEVQDGDIVDADATDEDATDESIVTAEATAGDLDGPAAGDGDLPAEVVADVDALAKSEEPAPEESASDAMGDEAATMGGEA